MRKMKDSGVEWIDKIPENWRTSKIKSVCSINSGEYVSKNDYVDNGKYDIMGANGKIGNINKKNVYEEVLIMGRVGTIGTFFIVNHVWVSDNALIIKNNTHGKFADYVKIRSDVREDVGTYLYKKTESKPVILTVITTETATVPIFSAASFCLRSWDWRECMPYQEFVMNISD